MGTVTSTPYDDVFRTMLNDCVELIIPVINEAFEEHYSGHERIVFSQNEHFINLQDGAEEKRITDSCFTITGDVEKKYLCECQSTPDNSMLVRIFEYVTQVALDQGEVGGNELEVRFPNSMILFLRCNENTPDWMKIRLVTDDDSLELDVRVMKAKHYTLEEIFEKNLLFLIPFYIFSHEARFKEYESNEKALKFLIAEYQIIANRLKALQEKGKITAYTHRMIREMSNKVLENIAVKYNNIRKGVGTVMGGKVLEYEAKTIFRNGMKQEVFLSVQEQDYSVQRGAEKLGVSVEEFEKQMKMAGFEIPVIA